MADRRSVPEDVAAAVLFESNRTCCVCRERRPVQLHHIDEDPSNNDPANLAVLCLYCHRDTQITGGFDRKLDAAQVRLYRADWVRVVANSRTAPAAQTTPPKSNAGEWQRGSYMHNYIKSLPDQRRAAYSAAQPGWSTGVTAEMMNASYGLTHSLRQYLAGLASFYPKGHFGDEASDEYLGNLERTRWDWHRTHLEPDGRGRNGTMVGPLAASEVIRDLENMVVSMVRSLTLSDPDFDFRAWLQDWRLG